MINNLMFHPETFKLSSKVYSHYLGTTDSVHFKVINQE